MTTYTSAADGNWSSAATWGGGGYPVAGDTAIITGYTVTLSGNAACAVLDCSSATGTLAFGNYTLTVTGGVTLGGTLTAGTGGLQTTGTQTLTSNGVTFPAKYTHNNNSSVITLVGDWINTGLVSILAGCKINKTTTETFTSNGGITVIGSGVLYADAANAKIILGGTGVTWTGTSSSAPTINNPMDINCVSLTLSTSVRYGTGTLTYVAGTITTTGNNLYLTSSCTLNTSGITWNNIILPTTATVTLLSDLECSGTLRTHYSTIFAGNFDISCETLSQVAASGVSTCTLVAGRTLTIGTAMKVSGTSYGDIVTTFCSSVAGTPTNIVYNGTSANCKNLAVIFTDIDASGGNTIYDYFGTLSNTTNITNFTDVPSGGGAALSRIFTGM